MDDVIGLVAPSPSGAERPAEDVVADVEQLVEVLLGALPVLEPAQHLDQPVRALPAGGALAARLVLVELGPAQHRADDAGRVVEDLQRPGAEHRTGRADGLEVERDVEVLGGEQRGRRAARRPELQLVPAPDAAGHVEQLAQRDAERGLVLARPVRRARTARRARSRCDRSVPMLLNQSAPSVTIDGTLAIDSTLFTTVGPGVQAGDGRERRLEPGLAAAALEGVEQRGLLAADVGARRRRGRRCRGRSRSRGCSSPR